MKFKAVFMIAVKINIIGYYQILLVIKGLS